MNTEMKGISLLNDYAFKSLFRSIASFLSVITGIEKQLLMEADYQGGELPIKLRDEEGHIETNQYHSIHLILENVVNTKYNIDEEIKKTVELLTTNTIKEMKDKFKGDEIYMAAIRKVEDLSKDPNFVGYYDVEEAKRQELEDMYDTGVSEGIEQGIEQGIKQCTIEVAKQLLALGTISIEDISKVTGLTEDKISKLA